MSTTRTKDAPVAAVYDHRKTTALIGTPQNKLVRCSCGLRPPKENESGAHRAPLQVDESLVAAVYDRRIENELGAHRDAATEQSLQKNARLQRLARVFVDSPVYFVTACTLDRRAILDCELVHDAFRIFCLNSPQHGAWVGRYVLMPDHLHLFVILDAISLSNWVKSLKNYLSKTLRSAAQEGPHWQKGFFDYLLRSSESYSQKWGYVRENPVRAGFVSKPKDWDYTGEIHDLEYRK